MAFNVIIKCGYEALSSHKNSYISYNNAEEKFYVGSKKESDLSALCFAIKEVKKEKLDLRQQQQLNAALTNIKNRIVQRLHINPLFSIFLKIFGPSQKRKDLENLLLQLNIKEQSDPVASHEEALLKFYGEFQTLFKTRPKARSKNDQVLIDRISQMIWESKQDYEKYKKMMQEFFIGTHMLFVETEKGNSTLEYLRKNATVNFRVSSHYGKVGAQTHNHIMGTQLPEVLFHEGDFGKKDKKILKGKYFEKPMNHNPELPCFILSEQERKEYQKIHAFWIQCERTPDGPSWGDWLVHRTVDFSLYLFLKKVRKVKRPQVAYYKSSELGRGLPDFKAIIIQPACQ
jgi:hypothetical protein